MEGESKLRILLVGGAGYLGQGLAGYFRSKKHTVMIWDQKEDLFRLTPRVLASKRVELLVNLSLCHSRQHARYQLDSPAETVNVFGARHLAKILQRTEIMWIQISTREVFPAIYRREDVIETRDAYRPKFLIGEDQAPHPLNFYGKTKLMAEFFAESHAWGNVIRLTSPYTDDDHPMGGWVLRILKNIAEGKPVTLSGTGKQFRDPLHVDDLGGLMEKIFAKKIQGEIFHAGGGRENILSLRQFVAAAGHAGEIQFQGPGDFGFGFDNRKASKFLDWKPSIGIRNKIPLILRNIRKNSPKGLQK